MVTATYFKVSPGIVCGHQSDRLPRTTRGTTTSVDDGRLKGLQGPLRKVAELLYTSVNKVAHDQSRVDNLAP